jgi:hypothetical protein
MRWGFDQRLEFAGAVRHHIRVASPCHPKNFAGLVVVWHVSVADGA